MNLGGPCPFTGCGTTGGAKSHRASTGNSDHAHISNEGVMKVRAKVRCGGKREGVKRNRKPTQSRATPSGRSAVGKGCDRVSKRAAIAAKAPGRIQKSSATPDFHDLEYELVAEVF